MTLENSNWELVTIEDTFNKGNVITAYLNKSDRDPKLYGAIRIIKINEEEQDTLIYCTPKFKYPFIVSSENNERTFAKIDGPIDVYEKVDGTNIFCYKYQYRGQLFQTYKSRQTVVLIDNPGMDYSFVSLWKEMLTRYQIEKFLKIYPFNCAFELFGSRNPILVKYGVPIDTVFLYGIDKDGNIMYDQLTWEIDEIRQKVTSVDEIDHKSQNVPFLKPCGLWLIKNAFEFEVIYKAKEIEMDKLNVDKLHSEGLMLYTHQGVFKLKPPTIFQAMDRYCAIPREAIKNTILNMISSNKIVNFDSVYIWLQEDVGTEYSEANLLLSKTRISNLIEEIYKPVIARMEARNKICQYLHENPSEFYEKPFGESMKKLVGMFKFGGICKEELMKFLES